MRWSAYWRERQREREREVERERDFGRARETDRQSTRQSTNRERIARHMRENIRKYKNQPLSVWSVWSDCFDGNAHSIPFFQTVGLHPHLVPLPRPPLSRAADAADSDVVGHGG